MPKHICTGWSIVCPDGLVRSYPYYNKGDAEFDAVVISKGLHRQWPDDVWPSPCPQGEHRVKLVGPIGFLHEPNEQN